MTIHQNKKIGRPKAILEICYVHMRGLPEALPRCRPWMSSREGLQRTCRRSHEFAGKRHCCQANIQFLNIRKKQNIVNNDLYCTFMYLRLI